MKATKLKGKRKPQPSGEVPAKYIKTASDREAIKQGCYWDEERANRVKRFFYKCLRHIRGERAGTAFKLLVWEWEEIVLPLYAWRMPDGTRRFRSVKVGIPKKNGKSTFIAGLALYELVEGLDGSQIVVAAGDKKQAKIIFDSCCDLAERSPRLKKMLKIRRSLNMIRYSKKQSKIEPLSADVEKKEGLDPTVVIFDELHTQPDRKLWNTLRYAMAARKQPLAIWLSTAGELDETALWFEEFELARKIIRGDVINISILPVMYEASKDDKWDALETFIKCNPSYGKTIDERGVLEDIEAARINGADELIYKRYRLNIPTSASATWLREELWLACGADLEKFKPDKAARIYAGLDLSLAHDITAFVVVVIQDGCYFFFPYFWLPESVFEKTKHDKANHTRYAAWRDMGLVKFTPCKDGYDVIDYEIVVEDIVFLCKAWGIDEIAIDKWNEARVATNLRRELKRKKILTAISTISANTRNMVQATSEFERLVKESKLQHSKHDVLNWMFRNVRIKIEANGNRQVSKGLSADKIDGIYASLVAIAIDIDEERKRESEEQRESRYLDPDAEVLEVPV